MYCVELTPAAYWIFAWLKKRQQYYSTLTRLQPLIYIIMKNNSLNGSIIFCLNKSILDANP